MNRLLVTFVFILVHVSLSAQHKYATLFEYFPERIPGFATDPHQVYTEDDGQKRYTNVSQMYYKPDGSCVIEIRLKDFSLNPVAYTDSWEDLKSRDDSYSLKDGRPFVYGKYNCLEKRGDRESQWVLFLGDLVLLELDLKGDDRGIDWLRNIASQLNMDAIRLVFVASRVQKL